MSVHVYSDEAEAYRTRTYKAYSCAYILEKLKFLCSDSYLKLSDNHHLLEVNHKDIQPEILLVKNLQKIKYEKGVANQELNNEKLLRILSNDEENIKKDVENMKKAIDEENEVLNKLQSRINALKRMRIIKTSRVNLQLATLELHKMFKKLKSDLNTLIEELYTVKEDEIRVILQELVSTSPSNSDTYPYVKVTQDCDPECIQYLLSTNVIELHPELNGFIKLSCVRE